MQGLVLQLTRAGFLMLLWLFIWSVLRILRTDIYAPTGAVMVRRGLALRGNLLSSRQRRDSANRSDVVKKPQHQFVVSGTKTSGQQSENDEKRQPGESGCADGLDPEVGVVSQDQP